MDGGTVEIDLFGWTGMQRADPVARATCTSLRLRTDGQHRYCKIVEPAPPSQPEGYIPLITLASVLRSPHASTADASHGGDVVRFVCAGEKRAKGTLGRFQVPVTSKLNSRMPISVEEM